MRIIAGRWKGSPLNAPPGKQTRPTGDRVKEALFSMIGPYFTGGKCLDLFAGSGALGLEALSRGMDFAVFVDIKSGTIIRSNVERLRAEQMAKIIPLHYEKAIKRLSGDDVFDLVFLDPPYALGVLQMALSSLVEHQLLSDGATVVAEMDRSTPIPVIASLELVKSNEYGATRICIYKKLQVYAGRVD